MTAAVTIKGSGMESNHSRLVDSYLSEWARWRLIQSGEVRGYPPETPFNRLRGSSVRSVLITDSTAEDVDAAVSKLIKRCPQQGKILALYYLERMTLATIARKEKMSETVARYELRAARNAIEWILESAGKL